MIDPIKMAPGCPPQQSQKSGRTEPVEHPDLISRRGGAFLLRLDKYGDRDVGKPAADAPDKFLDPVIGKTKNNQPDPAGFSKAAR